MLLEKELNTYKVKLADLKPKEGQFVLIQGDNVVGVYANHEAAMKQGRTLFGVTPFLVKQIEQVKEGCGCPGEGCNASVR
jgi:hypothetical protein